MTYVIVHALAPIFVIMLLGFWAGKAKMVDNKNVSIQTGVQDDAYSLRMHQCPNEGLLVAAVLLR